jgi:hypothetical protein
MIWVQRGLGTYSAPYRIYRETRGHAAWIYSTHGVACLGRDIATLAGAKELCEAHKAKNADAL